MSFIDFKDDAPSYQPGWFLADDENCTRVTMTISADHDAVVTAGNGSKFVPMGTFLSGKGILYEDVDVSEGDAPGSVVTAGHYYADRVSGTVTGVAGLISAGNAPTVVRPEGATGATGATGETAA